MPRTSIERLAALGLTADRPIAWILGSPELSRAESFDESLRLIDTRPGPDPDGEKEYRAVARTPEGDAALLRMLGLDQHPVGWHRWSSYGALHEAEWRGLCTVFRDPRSDGRVFVVANTPAGDTRWRELGRASAELFNGLPCLDPDA